MCYKSVLRRYTFQFASSSSFLCAVGIGTRSQFSRFCRRAWNVCTTQSFVNMFGTVSGVFHLFFQPTFWRTRRYHTLRLCGPTQTDGLIACGLVY
jgi:hypothetical protein